MVRLIFEYDGEDDFFDVVLTESEVDRLAHGRMVTLEVPYGLKMLNVCIRTEQIEEEDAT